MLLNFTPQTLTNESPRTLLDDLDAERSGHMRLVTVAVDGDVLRYVERLVRPTVVHPLRVSLRGTLVTADRQR